MYKIRCNAYPFQETNRFRQAGPTQSDGPVDFYPAVNAWGTDDQIVLTVDLPGVVQEDLNVTIEKDTVTLKGKRSEETLGESDQYGIRERADGEFSRTLRLPYAVDATRVEAKLQNGVLRLTLPKPEQAKPKTINIQVED